MSASSTTQVPTRIRTMLALGCLGAAGFLGGCDKSISDKDIQPISLTEVRALTDSRRPDVVLLIDPRSPAAYAQGHLPGARNMSLDEVSEQRGTDPELERYSNLVVYGEDPGTGTGRAMAKRLMSVGYKNVRLYFGGFAEWRRAGLEIRGGSPTEPAAKN